MAQERIEIRFTPKGDKALILAIKQLDIVTKRLTGQVSVYEKELKQLARAQAKSSNAILLGTRNMRNMGKGANKLGRLLSKLRSKLLIISFSVALVGKTVSSLVGKFIEQEKAEKKLEVALGKNITSLKNYASGLQQVTEFGDEAILSAQSLIGAFVKDEEQLKKATQATLDLAAAKGMDLNTAADLVGKTLGSSTNALSRYGIEVDHAVGSSARLESLTQNISRLFGGQARASAETLGGAVEQMKNAFGDASEAIGTAFAPLIKSIAKTFKNAAEGAREFFLQLTETPLEKTVRLIEEAGGNADNLRISMLRLEKFEMAETFSQMPQDLKSSEEVLNKIDYIEEVRMGRLRKQAEMERTLFNLGLDTASIRAGSVNSVQLLIDELQDSLDLYGNWVDLAENESDFHQESVESGRDIKENKIAELKLLKKNMELWQSVVKQSDDAIVNSDKQLENHMLMLQFLLQWEDKQRKINELTGTGVEEIKTFAENIKEFFTVTYAELFANIDEVAEHSKELFNEWGSMVEGNANKSIAAIDAASNKEIANFKKSAKFRKMTDKQRAAEEQKIRDKAEKDKVKKRGLANKIKLAEFRIDQAMRIKQAIMNTAEEVTKHVGNPVMAAITYAMGAAQIAMIASQKPPKMARGGLIGGKRHTQGGTMIEAERGEFIMSRDAVGSVGIETMNRINQGGGGGSVNVTFSGNVLSEDFIENEAIPQIRDAIRRGADIGVS